MLKKKKFWINTLIVFVAYMFVGFIVHGTLLRSEYMRLAPLYRSEIDAKGYMPIMLLAHLIIAGALVWLYDKGKEKKPYVGQGARFGLAIAMMQSVGMYLIYYCVQPLTTSLVSKQIVFDSIGNILIGILIAWLSRK